MISLAGKDDLPNRASDWASSRRGSGPRRAYPQTAGGAQAGGVAINLLLKDAGVKALHASDET